MNTQSSTPAIELQALTKIYYADDRSPIKVIDNVSLAAPAGRLFGLLGATGAGKTTLVELIGGLLEPTSGTITLNGQILSPADKTAVKQVGLALTGIWNLKRRLSIWENFSQSPQARACPLEKLRQRLAMLLPQLNLWQTPETPVHQLTPDQQRLVSFICALRIDPSIVIFDEPFVNLTPETMEMATYWLKQMAHQQGKTVVVATRSPEIIETLCDEVAILNQGQVMLQQPLARLGQSSQMAIYRIRVKGHLSGHWSEWFDNLTVTNTENGEAVLAGPIVDQAALYGVLAKVRNLALPLLSVSRVEPTLAEVAAPYMQAK